MADLSEIITDWTFENGKAAQTVMYFAQGGDPIADQRTDLGVFWAACEPYLDSLTEWTIRTSGDVLDSATGVLIGDWSEATARTGTGNLSGTPVPNSANILIRWATGSVVSGRRLRGRSFIPGSSSTANDGGHLGSAAIAAITTAANTFASAGNNFGVWHRPIQSAGGTFVTVNGASVWEEYAVQRRRR